MRIAQVVTYISEDGAFGGPVAVALAQCVELARQGHEVHLYAAWDGRAQVHAPGVRLHLVKVSTPRLGLTAIITPRLPLLLWRRRSRFDAVHLHFGRDLISATAWLAVHRSTTVLVLQSHGMLPLDKRPHARLFDAAIVRPALRSAAAVLALTEPETATLHQVAGSPIRTRRIDNGINVTDVVPLMKMAELEVLFLARLHPRKQVLVFAEAARRLLASGVSARFRIIGPNEGDLARLRSFIETHELRDQVYYDGVIGPGESETALRRAAVYVLPSTGEVCPMTVLEALAVGTPVLLSTDCALSDALGAAGAVALTEPTADGLTVALGALLGDDAARAELGLRGRNYAAAHLSIRAVADALITFYSTGRPRRAAILQPYVPEYRVAVWERVIGQLADDGIEARVFWGGSRRTLDGYRARGDLTTPAWSTKVPTIEARLSARYPPLSIRILPRGWRRADVTLTEMQVTNLNAWVAAALRQAFVTMGHGLSGTTTSSRIADALESAQNRAATRILVYTPEGRAAVAELTGLHARQITSFDNSTDTDLLRNALADTTPDDVAAFNRVYGIAADARIALYVGALETYKRIDLLIEAARHVLGDAQSDWHLVVAGDGPQRYLLETLAAETGRVTLLGRVGPHRYAPAAVAASVLLNPGRIGLVAVDALVMGIPLLTTSSAQHAPEFSYLKEGRDVVIGPDDPEGYARTWLTTARLEHSNPTDTVLGAERSADIIATTLREALQNGR